MHFLLLLTAQKQQNAPGTPLPGPLVKKTEAFVLKGVAVREKNLESFQRRFDRANMKFFREL